VTAGPLALETTSPVTAGPLVLETTSPEIVGPVPPGTTSPVTVGPLVLETTRLEIAGSVVRPETVVRAGVRTAASAARVTSGLVSAGPLAPGTTNPEIVGPVVRGGIAVKGAGASVTVVPRGSDLRAHVVGLGRIVTDPVIAEASGPGPTRTAPALGRRMARRLNGRPYGRPRTTAIGTARPATTRCCRTM
jgi:hypothetical protein